MAKEKDKEFKYSIKEYIGVVATYQTGWSKELNLVEWNDSPPKLDIRDWDPKHEHMSRGVTLHRDEAKTLIKMIHGYLKQTEAPKIEEAPKQEEAPQPLKTTVEPPLTIEESAAAAF